MKISKLSLSILSIGLAAVVFTGCSSSSDSGGPGGASVSLTPEAAESLAKSASSAIPGCDYRSDDTLNAPARSTTFELYNNTVKKLYDDRQGSENKSTLLREARIIEESTPGNCPTNPGVFTIKGTHENGVDDLTYTFDAYCTGDAFESTTITGVSHLKNVGEPSSSGPIPQYFAVNDGNMKIVEKSSEGTFTHTINGSNVKYTFGNGDNVASASNPNVLEIKSFAAVDGRTNDKLSISNAHVTTYENGLNSVVIVDNLTYTDSENGTVTISSTPIVTDDSGNVTGGDITVSGGDGTTMTMSPYDSVENGFGVEVDGEIIGVMDCSGQ